MIRLLKIIATIIISLIIITAIVFFPEIACKSDNVLLGAIIPSISLLAWCIIALERMWRKNTITVEDINTGSSVIDLMEREKI